MTTTINHLDGEPPSTLALDKYSQIQGVLLAWKRCARMQCERRNRVAAACRVGALFFQRLFWNKWQGFVVERRWERQEHGITRRDQIKDEVQALKVGRNDNITIAMTNDSQSTPTVDKSSKQGQHNAVVLPRKRHFSQRTKHAIRIHDNEMVGWKGIGSVHAIRRWQAFSRKKKDWDALRQRAYFFLYYWLLKRSLSQLGHYALVRKRKRQLFVQIKKANRQRLLMKTMQQWRLKKLLCQILACWRDFILRRRHQTQLYRPIADVLKRTSHRRLLQLTFSLWERQHARLRAQQALVHLLDRHLYRKICKRAWERWKVMVRQLVQIESFQRHYQGRTLRQIWQVWSFQTRAEKHREQQRRRAVRHYYLFLLRQGFNGFRTWLAQRQIARLRVDSMQDAVDGRTMALAFSRWDHFTSKRKRHADKMKWALRHYKARLLKRVWSKGFQCFLAKALVKKERNLVAQNQHYIQTLRRRFGLWKVFWLAEGHRNHLFDEMLRKSGLKKEYVTKSKFFEIWVEFARAKAARRVVNAQVRGRAQRRMLQKFVAQWLSYISIVRWQEITQARAEQHYRLVIWRKCFARWRHNVMLRQLYRRETRVALVHWKLTLQRKVVKGWKRYVHLKKMKQRRIHDALEFRHEQFVREGLRHWMTAALYIQEQREQHIARTQADITTHIWRRVAAIARHWHYLTLRRRAVNEDAGASFNNVSRRAQIQASWQSSRHLIESSHHKKFTAPSPCNVDTFREANVLFTNAGSSDKRSLLSEFVMLPRNRPQPRRPVEVLLHAQASTEGVEQQNQTPNMTEANRCGFKFPIENIAPVYLPNDKTESPTNLKRQQPDALVTAQAPKPHSERYQPSVPVPLEEFCNLEAPNTTANHLDVLERQLLSLSQRKREWKASQQQLFELRDKVKSNPKLMPKLRTIEEQHANRTKRWLRTKEKIQSLATEINTLRQVLQG